MDKKTEKLYVLILGDKLLGQPYLCSSISEAKEILIGMSTLDGVKYSGYLYELNQKNKVAI